LQSTEETRFIITPINGALTWAAVRLVEIYQSPSKNLAGLYIAPAGKDTGKVYLIQFPGSLTVIGPESAISAVTTDPKVKGQLTLHPDWKSGNILMYAVGGRLTYIIPYYGTQQNLNVPVMVAAVDGQSKQVGSYFIRNPNDFNEVKNAAGLAVASIGSVSGTQRTVTGTVYDAVVKYVVGGNTKWIIDINPVPAGPVVTVYASADALTPTDIAKIDRLVVGSAISVVVDANNNVVKVN
jgi:hypothetical protein